MADITLAEFNGRVWLVGGEAYLDDLLANTLASDVSIELVPCDNNSDVRQLWVQHCGLPVTIGEPWIIHPAIVTRIRRRSAGRSVFFAEWSALLDGDALTTIAAVAAWACDNPDAPVELVEFLDPAGLQAITDLSRLRARLIEDKLVENGLARGRITRRGRGVSETVGDMQENQRIDIVVLVADTPVTPADRSGA